jgi:AraC-like DNA-binding protein
MKNRRDFTVSRFKTILPYFRIPVHQYVMHRRVERAKQLLTSGLPSQFVLETGFAHRSHFARCTRRILGLTPGALPRLSNRPNLQTSGQCVRHTGLSQSLLTTRQVEPFRLRSLCAEVACAGAAAVIGQSSREFSASHLSTSSPFSLYRPKGDPRRVRDASFEQSGPGRAESRPRRRCIQGHCRIEGAPGTSGPFARTNRCGRGNRPQPADAAQSNESIGIPPYLSLHHSTLFH